MGSKFSLDDSLGFVLNRAAQRMKRAFELRLMAHDVTTAQWSVLARVAEEEGLTQLELAKRSMFDRPTITGIVSRLEARKLIVRKQAKHHARAYAVYLTAAGKALFAQLPPLAQEVNALAERNLSSAERRTLVSLLNRLSDNFADALDTSEE